MHFYSIQKAHLQPWIDGEASCRWVHAGHVLAIVDVLRGQLVAVVPREARLLMKMNTLTDSSINLHCKREVSSNDIGT